MQGRHAVSAIALVMCLSGCHRSNGTESDAGAAPPNAPVGSGPLAFLQGFEGEIGIAVRSLSKGKPEDVNLALAVRPDKIRFEVPQGFGGQPVPKGFAVLSPPEKKLTVVIDEQKEAVVVDLNTIGEQFKSMVPHTPGTPTGKDQPSKPPPKLTKTGATDKVAGTACDVWDVSEESKKVATLCIADQSNSWFHLPLTGIPTEYAWAIELMDGKHFPLRFVGYDKNGAEAGRAEVTKFEKKAVAPALFEIPAGYRVVDMRTMMAELMSGRGFGAAQVPRLGTRPLPAVPVKHK